MNYFLKSYNLQRLPDLEKFPRFLPQLPKVPEPVIFSLREELNQITKYQIQLLELHDRLDDIAKIRNRQLSILCEASGGHQWGITKDNPTGEIYCRRCFIEENQNRIARNTWTPNLHYSNFAGANFTHQIPASPPRFEDYAERSSAAST